MGAYKTALKHLDQLAMSRVPPKEKPNGFHLGLIRELVREIETLRRSRDGLRSEMSEADFLIIDLRAELAEVRETLAQCSLNWECHLFRRVEPSEGE